jgi:general secretion pathway protein G
MQSRTRTGRSGLAVLRGLSILGSSPACRRRRAGAFTLVEILIVVVILGILAAIVVPQFTSAAAESRQNSMRMTIHRIRTQLELYKEHHNQTYPTLASFEAQMTQPTDVGGAVVAQGAPNSFGPYIRELPKNPNTRGKTLGNDGVGTSDWYYDQATGDFHGNDSDASRAF